MLLDYMTQFYFTQVFAVALGLFFGGAVIYLISDYKLPSRIFPFVVYLRKNVATVLAIFTLTPVLTALAWWLLVEDIRSACTISSACMLWAFVCQYGIFSVITRTTGPHALFDDFKKSLIGVSGALVVGYIVFLLFSNIRLLPLGKSLGYFIAAVSVLSYYLGRYIGINNGLPILKKCLGGLCLLVSPTEE